MRLGEGQCRNVFRLDDPACRACAGHNKACRGYSPAEPVRKADKLNRPGKPDSLDKGENIENGI